MKGEARPAREEESEGREVNAVWWILKAIAALVFGFLALGWFESVDVSTRALVVISGVAVGGLVTLIQIHSKLESIEKALHRISGMVYEIEKGKAGK